MMSAVRIEPIDGIPRNNFHARCFLASANSSRRTSWRSGKASNC
jgi:hypothetical protein